MKIFLLFLFFFNINIFAQKINFHTDIFKKIAKKYKIDYKTLQAIAKKESDNHIFVIHLNTSNKKIKKVHLFKDKYEASYYINKVILPNKINIDIGLCQINSWWLNRYKINLEDLFDLEKNLNVAGRIYKHNLYLCKNNEKCALSLYNTGKKNSPAGIRYANQVLKIKKKYFD